jgi:SAM-dependent methyltransferase
MNTPALEIDPVWEQEIYSQGSHLNRYPFDCVVSFVFRHAPRTKPRAATRIVEAGCGAANNLWFAAREGFSAAGIDGSAAAIDFARDRFLREGLTADLRVGSFAELPWGDETFDLAIDRCSLTCTNPAVQHQAVAEIRRVLRPGGCFLYNAYSDRHTSARSGRRHPDGRVTDITAGTLTGVGGIYFSSRRDVQALFRDGWEVLRWEHSEVEEQSADREPVHAEWRVVVRKK